MGENQTLLGMLKSVIRPAVHQHRIRRKIREIFSGTWRREAIDDVQIPDFVQGDYYISSEKGIYHLSEGALYHLWPFSSYGIAFWKKHIFFSSSVRNHSFVFREPAANMHGRSGLGPSSRKLVCEVVSETSDDRIHQVTAGDNGVWVANTMRNSVI